MVRLVSVYRSADAARVLFELLNERTRTESISHQRMPTWSRHRAFIRSRPYRAWYLIQDRDEPVGSVYLSMNYEIGLFIFRRYRGRGYASEALQQLIRRNRLRKAFVNINPRNRPGLGMIKRLGGQHIQNTYRLDVRKILRQGNRRAHRP